jgi:hypothetical protein
MEALLDLCSQRRLRVAGLAACLCAATADRALAQQGSVMFSDAAPGAGITYQNNPTPRDAAAEAAYLHTPFDWDWYNTGVPVMSRMGGVAVIDADGDGYLDMVVTNPTSGAVVLYRNLLGSAGHLAFSDVTQQSGLQFAGWAAGVAVADIDNDGDDDLLVLGDNAPNHLFRNHGDGTFDDISAASGLAGDSNPHTSASFGDANGDGLVDVVIANSMNRETLYTCFNWVPAPTDTAPNQLFLNLGGGHFADASLASGIDHTSGFKSYDPATGTVIPRPDIDGYPTLNWSAAMVDYDLDGKLDVIFTNDQCNSPIAAWGPALPPNAPAVDRGFLQVFQGDGTGGFANRTAAVGTNHPGDWMGITFADFNCDGNMDMFATNFGDYTFFQMGVSMYQLGDMASRAFFGQRSPSGAFSFSDPGAGDLVSTVFGWGTAALDYDNDGYTDIVYMGGLDVGTIIDRSNPGTFLHNRAGSGQFDRDLVAYAQTDARSRRNVYGLAVGDLDNDGYTDVISVGTFNIPAGAQPIPYAEHFGAQPDTTARWFDRLFPTLDPSLPPQLQVWALNPGSGLPYNPGNLAVEINSGNNGNHWLKVHALGTRGFGGHVNRDGIGAVVKLTPAGGRTSMLPVVSGSSFLSQNSLTLGFGLGTANRATLEVLWPGGVRNRLYDVPAGVAGARPLTMPEIPFSFDDPNISLPAYTAGVTAHLAGLVQAGMIRPPDAVKLRASAVRAYLESHGG